jgi:hypothetical protein
VLLSSGREAYYGPVAAPGPADPAASRPPLLACVAHFEALHLMLLEMTWRIRIGLLNR